MTNILVQILLTFVAALTCSLILIPIIIKLSIKLNLVDKPNERKVHKTPIPRLGGVAIFLSAVLAIILSNSGLKAISNWPVMFTSVGVLFMVGIWDDLKDISAKLRFALQICCAIAVASTGIRLTSLHGILGINELNVVWQYIITVLIIVGVTNSFNLIDGVDGLAGGLAFIGICVLTGLSYQLKVYPLMIVLLAFAGALIGFLKNNLNPAKIFMGDGGSLVLGYLLSTTGILLIERSAANPALMHPSRVAVLITAILIIPVFDTVRVFTSRMKRGISPFQADKTHIHHLFLVAGLDHRKTSSMIHLFELVLVAIALFIPGTTSISIAIVTMVMLFHIITVILNINQQMEHWLAFVKKMEKEGIA
ncbi:MAG: undecaprenyl/decaprenyl-phosphate alpha-N-acetylglucosaminyl 1-phosphate transferase [Sphingobacteriales bacterium]|nr:MAG: undecaprenyl/decaprenyl-phosphate alpha-N-acetylglucosaminyl 1-phosphate transferase [Sphingobacteriales bacterium]